MSTFTQETVDAMSSEMELALAGVAKKYGVQIEVHIGKKHFDENRAGFSCDATVMLAEGVPYSKSAAEFQFLAESLGLKKTDLGSSFGLKGKLYTIIGITTNHDIETRRSDGKRQSFEVEIVKQALEAAAI